jgi:hypothetical protein
MTYEITDRADFQDKFAALMAANVSLITAGLEPSTDLSSKMINEFLNQFTVATPAPATPMTAGYVIVENLTGWQTGKFRQRLFDSEEEALFALDNWVTETGHGTAGSYGVRKATYFG